MNESRKQIIAQIKRLEQRLIIQSKKNALHSAAISAQINPSYCAIFIICSSLILLKYKKSSWKTIIKKSRPLLALGRTVFINYLRTQIDKQLNAFPTLHNR